MKRLNKFLLPLFTLLLAAMGAAMPFAASYMQDVRQSDPEIRSFDSFSLTLRQESDLGRTLALVSGSDYYIEENAEAEADARMTRLEALSAAEELLKELIQYGLLDSAVTSLPTIWPQELHANDGSVSIPTWTMEWNLPDAGDTLYVWMDDATGKAFLISLPSERYSNKYVYNVSSEAIYASAENWRAFLEDYYGTEVQLAWEAWFDYSARFSLTFPLGPADGEKTEYQLDLYIYFADGFTTLNPYVSPPGPLNESAYDS